MKSHSLNQLLRTIRSRLPDQEDDWVFGSVEVTNKAVVTHRDSYLLATLTAVSVRRPFFAPTLIVSGALTLFAIGTFDLLYVAEMLALAVVIPLIVVAGAKFGQLQLLSRDLKNTELSGAVWGEHRALQKIRQQIVTALRNEKVMV